MLLPTDTSAVSDRIENMLALLDSMSQKKGKESKDGIGMTGLIKHMH